MNRSIPERVDTPRGIARAATGDLHRHCDAPSPGSAPRSSTLTEQALHDPPPPGSPRRRSRFGNRRCDRTHAQPHRWRSALAHLERRSLHQRDYERALRLADAALPGSGSVAILRNVVTAAERIMLHSEHRAEWVRLSLAFAPHLVPTEAAVNVAELLANVEDTAEVEVVLNDSPIQAGAEVMPDVADAGGIPRCYDVLVRVLGERARRRDCRTASPSHRLIASSSESGRPYGRPRSCRVNGGVRARAGVRGRRARSWGWLWPARYQADIACC